MRLSAKMLQKFKAGWARMQLAADPNGWRSFLMIDEYKVETCDDCPLVQRVVVEGTIVCGHPFVGKDDDLIKFFGGPPPPWCPLRRMGMRIVLACEHDWTNDHDKNVVARCCSKCGTFEPPEEVT